MIYYLFWFERVTCFFFCSFFCHNSSCVSVGSLHLSWPNLINKTCNWFIWRKKSIIFISKNSKALKKAFRLNQQPISLLKLFLLNILHVFFKSNNNFFSGLFLVRKGLGKSWHEFCHLFHKVCLYSLLKLLLFSSKFYYCVRIKKEE